MKEVENSVGALLKIFLNQERMVQEEIFRELLLRLNKWEEPLYDLVLAPINPFTPAQRRAIRLRLTGLNFKEIGAKLDRSEETIKKEFYGTCYEGATPAQMGIRGIIATCLSKPISGSEILGLLIGDVVILKRCEGGLVNQAVNSNCIKPKVRTRLLS